jgi:hypothetical protein
MRRDGDRRDLVLALHLTKHGFAFVLFDGPTHPLEWGMKEIHGKHTNLLVVHEIRKIVLRYRPSAFVIEDYTEQGSRHVARIQKLYRALVRLADSERVPVYFCPRHAVRDHFAGTTSKYEIACAIAHVIPAFAPRLPRKRKPWMSEDPRQSLFDAAALGMTSMRRRSYEETSNSPHSPRNQFAKPHSRGSMKRSVGPTCRFHNHVAR